MTRRDLGADCSCATFGGYDSLCVIHGPRATASSTSADVIPAERAAVYLEVAAKLRATGERGSEVAALMVEQLADSEADALQLGRAQSE